MSTYLLAIAIGPVQEFIQAARKTRDLWFGSLMLSQIAQAAALELADHAELIFPDEESLKAGVPAPNKLLAILKEGKVPNDVAEQVQAKAQAVLDYHLQALNRENSHAIDTTLAEAQVHQFLEYYVAWALLPKEPGQPPSADDYANARTTAEQLLAGRKAFRDFAPPPPTSTVARDKSALDPGRDNVVKHDATDDERGRLKLKGKEGLDAVSLIKRTQGRDSDGDDRFVSTARVAIDPFVRRLVVDDTTTLARLVSLAKGKGTHDIGAERFEATGKFAHYADFRFDTQLFYDPRPDDPKETNADDARTFFKTATDAGRDLPGIVELPAYFAVVQADGDRMGKLISSLSASGFQAHQRFSWHSAQFSSKVNARASAYKGALIYSGGDDVLAFLPLDQALPFANAIRIEFTATMDALTGDKELTGVAFPSPMPTLSVGVSIGHYGEHLQRLLSWARETEGLAKKHGRNALAVTFHPRGAGDATATAIHSWSEDPVTTRWDRWIDFHRRDALPDGAAYELRDLAGQFVGIDQPTAAVMLGLERDRILGRKRGERGTRPLTENELRELGRTATSSAAQLRGLADELIISREIAKAIDTASRPLAASYDADPGDEVDA